MDITINIRDEIKLMQCHVHIGLEYPTITLSVLCVAIACRVTQIYT